MSVFSADVVWDRIRLERALFALYTWKTFDAAEPRGMAEDTAQPADGMSRRDTAAAKSFNPEQKRDEDGRWTSGGSAAAEQEADDIKRALRVFPVLADILKTGTGIPVRHKELGEILIEAGTTGKSGYGLKHIIEQRYKKDGKTVDEITALIPLIISAARSGRIIRENKRIIELERIGIVAIVAKEKLGRKEKWILTGFDNWNKKEAATDAIQTVIALYGCAPEYSFFRKQVGAVVSSLEDIAPRNEKSSGTGGGSCAKIALRNIAGVLESKGSYCLENVTLGDVVVPFSRNRRGLEHIISRRLEERLRKQGSRYTEKAARQETAALLYIIHDGIANAPARQAKNGNWEIEHKGIKIILTKDRNGMYLLTGYADNDKKKAAEETIQAVIAQYGYTPEFLGVYARVGAAGSRISGLSDVFTITPDTEKSRDCRIRGNEEAATDAIQTVIALYGCAPEYSYFRKQVGAVVSSLEDIAPADGMSRRDTAAKSFNPEQKRDESGRWTSGGGLAKLEDVIGTILDGTPEEKEALSMSFFKMADTPEVLKKIGLAGDMFTVRYGVIARHRNKDEDHRFTAAEWKQICRGLTNPFAVSRYKDGYNMLLDIKKHGRYVLVGVQVKSAGKNMQVNAVATVHRKNSYDEIRNNLIYVRNKTTPDQQALLNGTNPHQYQAGRRSPEKSGTENIAQAAEKSTDGRKKTTPDQQALLNGTNPHQYQAGRRSPEESGTENIAQRKEKSTDGRKKTTPDQQALLNGTNPHQYQAGRRSPEESGTENIAQRKEKSRRFFWWHVRLKKYTAAR